MYNADELERKAKSAQAWAQKRGLKLLYALKAQSFSDVFSLIGPYLDGYAASSAFEVHWAREFLRPQQVIHYSSPVLHLAQEFSELPLLISSNSWQSWAQHGQGLRLHPEIHFAQDPRFDPSAPDSHLGIGLSQFCAYLEKNPGALAKISGISFHAFCELGDFRQGAELVRKIMASLGPWLSYFQWINLGGGFLLEEGEYQESFDQALSEFKKVFHGDLYIEPGYDLVEGAFCLKTKVMDVIKNNVILDTTINHLPEVPQFSERPILKEETPGGGYQYQLCGCSCLVSDRFGLYEFSQALKVGDELTFLYTGAYSLVKANRFNGINFPSLYRFRQSEGMVLRKSFSYQDFREFYLAQ